MTRGAIALLSRLLTGVNVRSGARDWTPRQRIFFANHTSHLDFLVVWAALPDSIRATLRPVAARDYWEQGRVRPWLAHECFRAVLIDRKLVGKQHPLAPVFAALEAGDSTLVFPEGTRSLDGTLGEFKAGLFSLTDRFPNAELIPVHVENLNRILPKGDFLPVPFICTVRFGEPLERLPAEKKHDFLARARGAVAALAEKGAPA